MVHSQYRNSQYPTQAASSMHYLPLSLSLLASGVTAWLPADRDLAAFNQTARFEKLGKRYEPSLPSGQTKIRGVNFGMWLISEPFFMANEWYVWTKQC